MEQGCVECILRKNLTKFPEGADPEKVRLYQEKVRQITREVSARPDGSSPEIVSKIEEARMELFQWAPMDYGRIKTHFNGILVEKEEELRREIRESEEPLRLAVQMALAGNYIDFAALDAVPEEKLWELLEGAKDIPLFEKDYQDLKEDIAKGKRAVYITDNCGEVVLDKLLIEQMKRENPSLLVTVIVRGAPVHNDATLEDAAQVGLYEVAEVMPNGSTMNGTVFRYISQEARETILGADFLIAKGQANRETLEGCGLNVYYAFLCKCERFTTEYSLPFLTGVLTREKTFGKKGGWRELTLE